MQRFWLVLPIAGGLVAGAALSGLAKQDAPAHEVLYGPEAQAYAVEVIGGQVETLEFREVGESYADYLPNQEFVYEDGSTRPLSAALVSGRVESVQPSVGYAVDGRDADRGTVTSFEDPEARWRVVEMVVVVKESTGEVEGDKSVSIGLSIPGSTDFESFRNGLVGRTVLAPLSRQGFFDGADDLWLVSRHNTLLSFVAPDGTVETPFLESPALEGWEGETAPATLNAVFNEAEEPREDVELGETNSGFAIQE